MVALDAAMNVARASVRAPMADRFMDSCAVKRLAGLWGRWIPQQLGEWSPLFARAVRQDARGEREPTGSPAPLSASTAGEGRAPRHVKGRPVLGRPLFVRPVRTRAGVRFQSTMARDCAMTCSTLQCTSGFRPAPRRGRSGSRAPRPPARSFRGRCSNGACTRRGSASQDATPRGAQRLRTPSPS